MKFVAPEIEVIPFKAEDAIAASLDLPSFPGETGSTNKEDHAAGCTRYMFG